MPTRKTKPPMRFVELSCFASLVTVKMFHDGRKFYAAFNTPLESRPASR